MGLRCSRGLAMVLIPCLLASDKGGVVVKVSKAIKFSMHFPFAINVGSIMAWSSLLSPGMHRWRCELP
jgi:hypothetical protein